jgi:hypothetical protein
VCSRIQAAAHKTLLQHSNNPTATNTMRLHATHLAQWSVQLHPGSSAHLRHGNASPLYAVTERSQDGIRTRSVAHAAAAAAASAWASCNGDSKGT